MRTSSAADIPLRQIRAVFDERTIRVYQAFSSEIADAAIQAGTFVAPFKMDRMTWIKPSFLWMMYRSGWAKKDARQERVLAIDITRSGFEWALRHSSLSHRQPPGLKPPVRVQWDPERSILLGRLPHRAIQMGLSGAAVRQYVDEWIVQLTDITPDVHAIKGLLDEGRIDEARARLPSEHVYPTPSDIAARLRMT